MGQVYGQTCSTNGTVQPGGRVYTQRARGWGATHRAVQVVSSGLEGLGARLQRLARLLQAEGGPIGWWEISRHKAGGQQNRVGARLQRLASLLQAEDGTIGWWEISRREGGWGTAKQGRGPPAWRWSTVAGTVKRGARRALLIRMPGHTLDPSFTKWTVRRQGRAVQACAGLMLCTPANSTATATLAQIQTPLASAAPGHT